MKIQRETVTKTVQEVEVTLPYFSKIGIRYYAILSEKEAIRVVYNDYEGVIKPLAAIATDNPKDSIGATEITRAEFESMYIKANDYLSEQFESLRDVKSGTTVDDVLKNMDA